MSMARESDRRLDASAPSQAPAPRAARKLPQEQRPRPGSVSMNDAFGFNPHREPLVYQEDKWKGVETPQVILNKTLESAQRHRTLKAERFAPSWFQWGHAQGVPGGAQPGGAQQSLLSSAEDRRVEAPRDRRAPPPLPPPSAPLLPQIQEPQEPDATTSLNLTSLEFRPVASEAAHLDALPAEPAGKVSREPPRVPSASTLTESLPPPSQLSSIRSGYNETTALHIAAERGDQVLIQRLVAHGADIEAWDNHGDTPLHIATGKGHIKVLRELVALGANVEARDENGRTALHMAAFSGQVELLEELVDLGASVHATNPQQLTSLHYAASAGQVEMLSLLMDLGADVEAKDARGLTALYMAAVIGQTEAMCVLADSAINVDTRTPKGYTALHGAAMKGKVEAVRVRGTAQTHAMLRTCRCRPSRAIRRLEAQVLVELGADVDARDHQGRTALHLATLKEQVHVLRVLVELGARLHEKDDDGATAVHHAAATGQDEALRVLLELGADAGDGTREPWPPDPADSPPASDVLTAAMAGQVDVLHDLFEEGQDVDAVDAEGRTAAHWTAAAGQLQTLRTLVELGADLQRHDARGGLTPFHCAAEAGQEQVMSMLAELGADIDAADNAGRTALHIGVRNGHLGMVRTLLVLGCSVGKQCRRGLVPAEYTNDPAIIELLEEWSGSRTVGESRGAGAYSRRAPAPAPAVDRRHRMRTTRDYPEEPDVSATTEPSPPQVDYSDHPEGYMEDLRHESKSLQMRENERCTEHGERHTAPYRQFKPRPTVDVNNLVAVRRNGRFDDHHPDSPQSPEMADDPPREAVANALHMAAMIGQVEALEPLLDRGADIEATTPKGCTALHIAAMKGHPHVVCELHRLGCDMDSVDRRGFTALHWATIKEKADVMETLVELGASLEVHDQDGLTPLHWAARKELGLSLRVLVHLGADVGAMDQQRRTALYWTAEKGQLAALRMLVTQGCDVEGKDVDGDSAMHTAAAKDQTAAVCALLQFGAKHNATNRKGLTALQVAAKKGHVATLRCMVELGAKVDWCGERGHAALHHAAAAGVLPSLHVLAELGANVNVPNHCSATPLHAAASTGAIEALRTLIQLGAHLTALDSLGASALHYSVERCQVEAAKELMAHSEACLHMQDAQGNTPLHVAAQHPECPEMWYALLEHGADTDAEVRNNERKTPLDLANAAGYTLATEAYVEHTMWLKMNNLPSGTQRLPARKQNSASTDLQQFFQCCAFLSNGADALQTQEPAPIQKPTHTNHGPSARNNRPSSHRKVANQL